MEPTFPWQSSWCCSLYWQLEGSCCHAGVMAIAGARSHPFSNILLLTTRLGMDSELGGDTTKTPDSNRPKGYHSIPYGTCSAIMAKRKEGKRTTFLIYGICVPEQPLQVLKLCFLRSGQTCWWEVENKISCSPLFPIYQAAFILTHEGFFLSYLLPTTLLWRVSDQEQLGGQLMSHQGQSTNKEKHARSDVVHLFLVQMLTGGVLSFLMALNFQGSVEIMWSSQNRYSFHFCLRCAQHFSESRVVLYSRSVSINSVG